MYASSEALQLLICRIICHVRYSADSTELLNASGLSQSDELEKVLRNSDRTRSTLSCKAGRFVRALDGGGLAIRCSETRPRTRYFHLVFATNYVLPNTVASLRSSCTAVDKGLDLIRYAAGKSVFKTPGLSFEEGELVPIPHFLIELIFQVLNSG